MLMPVAQKLKQARLAQGLSLSSLARASGLSKGFLSQVESGDANPSLASLQRLASALSMTMGELLSDQATAHSGSTRGRARLIRRVPGERARSSVTQVGAAGTGIAYVAYLEPSAHLESGELAEGRDAYLMVLSGDVRFSQAGEVFVLAEGDSLSFPLSERYLLTTTGRKSSLLLVFSSAADLPRIVEPPVRLDFRPAEKSAHTEGPLRLVAMRAARSAGRGR